MAPSQNNNDLAVTDSQPLPAQQGATPATTTAPAPGDLSVVKSEPAPGPTWLDSVGDYAKGVWSQINPVSAVKGVAQAVSHPIDTATQMLQNQGALADKAKTAFQSGDYVTGLRHSLDYLLPVIGPSIDATGDKAQAGKPAEALGEATGFAVPAALGARSVALPAAPADLTKAAAKTATATNSLAFWLTARRHGLAGNGQYCAKGLSPVRQLDRYPPPDLARWPHSRAPFSVSPITSARLVNCQAGSGCAGVNAKEALCFSGGFPTADQQRNLAVARKVLVVQQKRHIDTKIAELRAMLPGGSTVNNGKTACTHAPRTDEVSSRTPPLCARIMPCTSDRPSPRPINLVVKKGSKTRPANSLGTPAPLSLISSRT